MGETYGPVVGELVALGIATTLLKGPTKGAAPRMVNSIPKGKLGNHLFKGANKLKDTPANRSLIGNISNKTPLGVDPYGKSWHIGVDNTGKSIYSYTQDGVVKGAGYRQYSADQMIKRYNLKTK